MIWILFYIIYSIGGFLFMYDYYHKCALGGATPFGESFLKFVGSSLLLGAFTTLILICTVVSVLWESFNDSCKK